MNVENELPALTFRAPEPEDLDFLYRIENDMSVWPISEYTMPLSRYALKQYIAKCSTDFFAEKQLRMMVTMDGAAEPVAIVDLYDFHPLDGRAELGIIVAPEHRNKGVGTRAVGMLCDYASRVLGLRMLAARVLRENAECAGILRENGFEKVAYLPEWVVIEGKARDLVLFRKKL